MRASVCGYARTRVCAHAGGDGVRRRGAQGRGSRQSGGVAVAPALPWHSLPAVAEAAERLLSRVTPESWVARTPERRRCQPICQTILLPIRNN